MSPKRSSSRGSPISPPAWTGACEDSTLISETGTRSPFRWNNCWTNRPPWGLETALKVLATLLLALLAFQGKEILRRLDALERNQTKIFVALGIPPVAMDTLDFGVKAACLGPGKSINEIKPGTIP